MPCRYRQVLYQTTSFFKKSQTNKNLYIKIVTMRKYFMNAIFYIIFDFLYKNSNY